MHPISTAIKTKEGYLYSYSTQLYSVKKDKLIHSLWNDRVWLHSLYNMSDNEDKWFLFHKVLCDSVMMLTFCGWNVLNMLVIDATQMLLQHQLIFLAVRVESILVCVLWYPTAYMRVCTPHFITVVSIVRCTGKPLIYFCNCVREFLSVCCWI